MGLRRNAVIESPPPFNYDEERQRLLQHEAACWQAVQDAKAALDRFHGQHYSKSEAGLVPKVSVGVVDNFVIDQQEQELVRAYSRAVDAHQAAMVDRDRRG
jgi:hypothetical protein